MATKDEVANAIARQVVQLVRDYDWEIPELTAYAPWEELQRLATDYEVAEAREQTEDT